MAVSKSEFAESLKSKPVRPLDPANMANDNATLKALAGAMNNPRAEALEKLDSFQRDTTKYSGPTGTANATLIPESLPDESTLPQRPVSVAAQPPVAPTSNAPTSAQPAAPSLGKPLSDQLRMVITGRDAEDIAGKIGARVFSIDAALYRLAEAFFPVPMRPGGPVNPVAGAQSFIDTLRAWGAAVVSPAFPINATRATFITLIHSLAEAGQLPKGYDWAKFGKDEGFWVDSMVETAKKFAADNPGQRLAFVGASSTADIRYFQALGCTHWHISGPANVAKVSDFDGALDQSVIQAISKERNGKKLRAVWVGPTPPSNRLWTLAEFIRECQLPVAADPVDISLE